MSWLSMLRLLHRANKNRRFSFPLDGQCEKAIEVRDKIENTKLHRLNKFYEI
jgi:hypothetical protein